MLHATELIMQPISFCFVYLRLLIGQKRQTIFESTNQKSQIHGANDLADGSHYKLGMQ